MAVTNSIRNPFSENTVFALALDESQKGTDGLKDRVTTLVKEVMGVDTLPDRVRTWIHRHCLVYTAPSIPFEEFTGKLALPIDLDSLPNRKK